MKSLGNWTRLLALALCLVMAIPMASIQVHGGGGDIEGYAYFVNDPYFNGTSIQIYYNKGSYPMALQSIKLYNPSGILKQTWTSFSYSGTKLYTADCTGTWTAVIKSGAGTCNDQALVNPVNNLAWFNNTVTKTNTLEIKYKHWSTPEMIIYLYNPSGTLVKTYTPSYNPGNIGTILYKPDPVITGVWKIGVNGNYNYAKMGFFTASLANDFWLGHDLTNQANTMACLATNLTSYDDNPVGTIGFKIKRLDLDSGYPWIQVNVTTSFNGYLNNPLGTTYPHLDSQTIHIKQIASWSSGTATYGSSNGIATILWRRDLGYAGAQNISYPEAQRNTLMNTANTGVLIADTALAMLEVGTGPVGWGFTVASIVTNWGLLAMGYTSPPANNPNDVQDGHPGDDSAAQWGNIGDSPPFETMTYNTVNIYLKNSIKTGGALTNYCFQVYCMYKVHQGLSIDTRYSPSLYICVTA